MDKNVDQYQEETITERFNSFSNRSPRFHRISSMLLDHFILCGITIPIAIVLMMIFRNLVYRMDHIPFFFIIFIYSNKDFLKGKSPAKRILGYQIINRKTGLQATELQCFIRNLTICIAWPIEVIISFINPKRRIGDFIANTKVVPSEKQNLKSIIIDLKEVKLKIDYLMILILGGIYIYGFSLFLPSF